MRKRAYISWIRRRPKCVVVYLFMSASLVVYAGFVTVSGMTFEVSRRSGTTGIVQSSPPQQSIAIQVAIFFAIVFLAAGLFYSPKLRQLIRHSPNVRGGGWIALCVLCCAVLLLTYMFYVAWHELRNARL